MLSLVIPAYNEGAVIEDTVKTVLSALPAYDDIWELLLVDDGSKDDTLGKLHTLESENVHIISYTPNRGKGFAVRQGMLAAKGELVFYTDADLAYGLDVIRSALEIFDRTGADLVIGSRKLDKEAYAKYPPARKILSGGFSLASRMLSGMKYDTQCGFKGFKREAAQAIFSVCEEERFAFDFEVMMTADKLCLHVEEMPVRIINHRESKVNIMRDSVRMARDVLKIKRRLR